MSNNLIKVERNLKSIAKRYRTIKYSLGLAILFLMIGTDAFTEETITRQTIQNSVGSLQTKINTLRSENEKQLKGLRLELVQLMEQGDQVIKSPWSSWQFGIGYSYSKWSGKYKGRSDKSTKYFYGDNTILQRDSSILARTQKTMSGGAYGITDLDLESTYEPSAEITVSASIRPKSINKRTPNLQLQAVTPPNLPQLNISLHSPGTITIPQVNSPIINLNIVEPNAKPFDNFYNEGLAAGYDKNDEDQYYSIISSVDISGGVFWSGVKADESGKIINEAGFKDATQNPSSPRLVADFDGAHKTYEKRHNAIYFGIYGRRKYDEEGQVAKYKENIITGGKYYVAGDFIHEIEGNPYAGTTIFALRHGDLTFKNIDAYLYGRAAVLDARITFGVLIKAENLNIKVLRDNNTLFNFRPENSSDEWLISGGSEENHFYTYYPKFSGKVNAEINSRKNTVFLLSAGHNGTGFTIGGIKLLNEGDIIFNGASNIGFSCLIYTANRSKYIDKLFPNYQTDPRSGDKNKSDFEPVIRFSKPLQMYGDENVGAFFGKKYETAAIKKKIGIYQGKLDLNMEIGKKLNSDNKSEQIEEGRINKIGYTSTTVDGNVGIFAQTGQREGIYLLNNPSDAAFSMPYQYDPIKNLMIDKFSIKFGKYSNQGFMFLAKEGTVIEISDTAGQTEFSDGINGTNTTENDLSKGTIIAYAEGKWTKGNTKLGQRTGYDLEGKPTEIIVNQKLNMMSKEGIAFLGRAGGKITANKNVTAHGYASIIGYAEEGTVEVNADVEAKDKAHNLSTSIYKNNKYKNIGAYAKDTDPTVGTDTTVTINGNATINGLGALADGDGAKIYLKGTTNKIYTGTEGGLVAKNKGIIEFHGGTIVNKDNSVDRGLTDNDHKNTTPFYATDDNTTLGTTKGKIVFTGSDTNIEMYDGILVYGKASDYASASSPNPLAKYQGMEKVKVKLMSDRVNLGVFSGLLNLTWAGNSSLTTFTNGLLAIPKFGSLDPNGKSFKSTLTEGTLTINSNVNLTDNSDKFNGILMERELVTINSGKTVTGNGKGLSMGSNSGASSNATSGYINKGTVNITGGTISSGVAGINVSYGRILNDTGANVKVDNGAALYGTNGSTLQNKGTLTITGSGSAMAGLSKGTTNYGNSKVELINNNIINTIGKNSVGIYAESNKSGVAQSDITINNTGKISVSGNNSVGIVVKNSAANGGVVTLGGTGSSDIVTGKNGIGIYTEDSKIVFNTDYGIETKDNGVGLYLTKTSNTVGNKVLNYKYSGSTNGNGIATLYSGVNSSNNLNINLINSTNTTGGLVGIFAKGTGVFTNSGSITGTSKEAEFGIVANNTNIVNNGSITLANATNLLKGNVGIFAQTSSSKIINNANVTVGNNSIGLYGYNIVHNNGNITAGNNGIGIFSQGGNLSLIGGKISVANTEAVGVFIAGNNQTISSTNSMTIGDTSYGFVIKGTNYNLTTNNAGGVNLGNDSVFIYSNVGGNITNRTILTATGNKNYGIYSAGNVTNLANIDFSTGYGNVGLYSISYKDSLGNEILGRSVNGVDGLPMSNQPRIKIGESNVTNKFYSIGMAAGYTEEDNYGNVEVKSRGKIVNYGTIDVLKDNGIGMYAVGNGSIAENNGVINLRGKKTIGMYLDHGAIGINRGKIIAEPNATNDGIIGVVALNGAILKNYGEITINSPNGIGFYAVKKDGNSQPYEDHGGTVTANGDGAKPKEYASQNDTGKVVKGLKIVAPAGATKASIIREGKLVNPVNIDTNIASANPTHVTVGGTTLDLRKLNIPSVNFGQASTLGMYVDTSGVNYTNPIKGLNNLTGLRKVNLVFGSEAARYTNEKDIVIGDNILKPYNKVISQISNSGTGNVKWKIDAASLTWIATVTQNSDFTIAKLYISKIPYTSFAKDSDTYNFMVGLEEKYGKPEQKEKEIFNKLNDLGKSEARIFAQAVDEMRGKQYANIQQRINTTENILDKEFKNLRTEKNMSKDSNKIKTFGAKGEYKTDTAGIVDYKYNAYGVAYVHESEDIKLGKGIGWYTGIVHNKFKFKDTGKSKEEQLQTKLGIFKSRPYDDNNSLNWTTSAEIFVGYNRMDRKFLVVDEIYQAKSKYYTYGIGIRNEVSKEYRLSEDFRLKPYAALKLEYGRVSKIKEKNGEIKLEVKSNDYISTKPEIGTELAYRHYFWVKTLNTSIGMAYENELGKVANGKNKAKVSDTNADWFNIRGEKEDRKGNVKFDLNVGLDNQRFGVTGNVGYDTKGSNLRGGLGLRVIF